jgi:PAS domain S-box-containing protein
MAAWGIWFAGCFGLSVAAFAADAMDDWRDAASRTRILADNDAPRAYENALRLQATLPADATAADRARALNLLARIEIHLAQTEKAMEHAQQALALATSSKDRVGQTEAELNIAINSVNQGRIDALITAATQSLAAVDGVDRPDLLNEALLRTAIMYRRIGQFDESVTMAMHAMEIARRSRDPLALTYAHQGMAISFSQSERFEEARDHYAQMRVQARCAHSKLMEAYALAGLGSTLDSLGDYAAAEAALREAIGLYKQVGTPVGLTFGLFGLADHMRHQGRSAEALPLLDETIGIYGQYPNKIGLWYTLNARSSNHLAMGNLAAAQADAEQASTLAKDIGFPLYQSESAHHLAAIAAASGDHRKAYALELEATEMTARAAREKSGARMTQLAQRYESESKQREIDELTRRNQQQTTELRQRTLQQRWLWTVLGGSGAALAGTAYFLFRMRRSQRLLRAVNAQLASAKAGLEAANRFQTGVLDGTNYGIVVTSAQDRSIRVFNAGAEKILGYARDELIGGHRPGFFFDPAEAAARLAEIENELGQKLPDAGEALIARARLGLREEREWKVRRKDGSYVPVLLNLALLRGAENEITGYIEFFYDLTEQKRAQEALLASEQRFRQVTENIEEVFWLSDVESNQLIYISPAYQRVWGRSCESLYDAPQSWLESVHTEDRSRVGSALRMLTVTGAYDLDYRILRPDGVVRWIHDRAFPIKEAGGRVHRIAGVAEDITLRRQLEEQFHQAKKMELIGQLAGGVAHDFNNLLAVIQLQSTLLLSETAAQPSIQEGLQQIMQASERAANLTRQLLTFSRHDVRQARDIDLAQVTGTMTKLLRRLLGEAITMETRFPPTLPLINADPGMMEQVVMNLAINARDAMANGGRMLITLAEVKLDSDHLVSRPQATPGPYVRLSVSDTGCGIPPDSLPRIFEPFFTTKEEGKGTGLGLATVFGIVAQHHGWIDVSSTVGQGTTFDIFLPALPESPLPPAAG